MDAKKTGQLICETRKQHGMSQKDLADILSSALLCGKGIQRFQDSRDPDRGILA